MKTFECELRSHHPPSLRTAAFPRWSGLHCMNQPWDRRYFKQGQTFCPQHLGFGNSQLGTECPWNSWELKNVSIQAPGFSLLPSRTQKQRKRVAAEKRMLPMSWEMQKWTTMRGLTNLTWFVTIPSHWVLRNIPRPYNMYFFSPSKLGFLLL